MIFKSIEELKKTKEFYTLAKNDNAIISVYAYLHKIATAEEINEKLYKENLYDFLLDKLEKKIKEKQRYFIESIIFFILPLLIVPIIQMLIITDVIAILNIKTKIALYLLVFLVSIMFSCIMYRKTFTKIKNTEMLDDLENVMNYEQ